MDFAAVVDQALNLLYGVDGLRTEVEKLAAVILHFIEMEDFGSVERILETSGSEPCPGTR